MNDFLNSHTVNNFGLLLDIVGAFFLSKGIILRFGPQIVKETDDLWDGNPLRLKSAAVQFVEGWAGFVLLFSGFGLQFAASIASESTAHDRVWPLELGCAIVVFGITYKVVDKLAKRRSRKLVAYRWKPSIIRNMKSATESYVRLFEEALSLKVKKGQSIEDRKQRIKNTIKEYDEK
jgi:hypothetical protein